MALTYRLISPEKKTQVRTNQDQESTLGYLGRTGARSLARAGEAVLGLPGDITNVGLHGLNYLTGGLTPTQEQVAEKAPGSLLNLPTSSKIRERLKQSTGEFLEPRGFGEEVADEVIGDLATLGIPMKRGIPFSNLMKRVGGIATRSLGGTLASKGVEELGGGPVAQGITKFLFMTAPSGLGGRRAITEKMKDAFKSGEEAAAGKTIKVPRLQKDLKETFNNLSKRRDIPDKKFILDRINAVQKNISKKGAIEVNNLWDLKRDINSHISKLGAQSPPYLKKIVGMLKQPLESYAAQAPSFGKFFNTAEDIARGMANTSNLTNFLGKVSNYSLKHPLLKALIFKQAPQAVGGAIAGLFGTKEISKFTDLVMKSKEARKLYGKLLLDGAKQNSKAAARTLTKLDEWAYKNFPTDKRDTKAPLTFRLVN